MSDSSVRVTIPVRFKDETRSLKEMIDNFKKSLNNIDLESTLGKSLQKVLGQAESSYEKMQDMIDLGSFSKSELANFKKLYQSSLGSLTKFRKRYSGADVSFFNLDESTIELLERFNSEIKHFQNLQKTIPERSLSKIADKDTLSQIQKILGKGAAGEKLRDIPNLITSKRAENDAALQNALNIKIQSNLQIQSYKKELENLEQIKTFADKIQLLRKELTGDTKKIDFGKDSFGFNQMFSDALKESDPIAGIQKLVKSYYTSTGARKSVANSDNMVSYIMSQFGFTEDNLSEIFSGGANKQSIIDDIFKKQKRKFTPTRLARAQTRADSIIQEQVDQLYSSKVAQTQLGLNEAQKSFDDSSLLIKTLQNTNNVLNSLEATIATLLMSQQSRIADAAANENDRRLGRNNLINQIRKDRALPDSKMPNLDFASMDESLEREYDAKDFEQNLKASIKQWMSAYEIIGLIKRGIREAYQDIKELDTAMTNIAVVTDMTTDQLWGKIDEYMTIAQRYGVTTQGVYEVSQLYYQQGLGESEVMAATTETLKMARIAGIDYSDAADGMTVAVRAFNMEMEDAARVTDVYSEIAAVTASETSDLIEAMSKTASSAASVGSSFENTSAMIAVMVD